MMSPKEKGEMFNMLSSVASLAPTLSPGLINCTLLKISMDPGRKRSSQDPDQCSGLAQNTGSHKRPSKYRKKENRIFELNDLGQPDRDVD